MDTIHRYNLEVTPTQEISVRFPAKFISFILHPHGPCLYAEVDTESTNEQKYSVALVGAGKPLPLGHCIWKFLGTAIMPPERYGRLILHCYVSPVMTKLDGTFLGEINT